MLLFSKWQQGGNVKGEKVGQKSHLMVDIKQYTTYIWNNQNEHVCMYTIRILEE